MPYPKYVLGEPNTYKIVNNITPDAISELYNNASPEEKVAILKEVAWNIKANEVVTTPEIAWRNAVDITEGFSGDDVKSILTGIDNGTKTFADLEKVVNGIHPKVYQGITAPYFGQKRRCYSIRLASFNWNPTKIWIYRTI